MKGMKLTLGILLGIVSAWLVLNGVSITLQTMGRVTGSEFSMLITLANLAANIILWLGLFGLWSLTPSPTTDGTTLADGTEQ
jgi:hypothetical protein